jgi:F0F1-type ATP synthase membrane subunit b/b'
MQTLYDEAQKRQSDFEKRLENFNGAITRTLSQAETKAREVGAFLAEASTATAGALSTQYEELRQTAARERERTATEIAAAYQQNLGEMNETFAQAAERYKAVSAELRGMTGEIHRELEATRQELRRGAVELPRETGEQTAAMRRVVADQIKALSELTDLVARSGRAHDISEPSVTARPEPAPAPRREATRPEAPRESRFDLRPASQRAPAPASSERGGWMSDLLARASVEEQPAKRASSGGDPLDNLSADIARVFDENALIDAWDGYRRGEGAAFTRRLYTSHGLKTFEEVRRRYGADADFRQTVDRYLQEFERLLMDIDREDRDGSQTRSYLLSETGKVYTLLAHASGRLG